ncbi:MAG TPA: 3-carboxy-cis,cis-muconate cycloisomerase [Devosiaceae bacterium]
MGELDRPLLAALTGDAEIEALLSDRAMLRAMLEFEGALAEAEAEAGLIGHEAAEDIADAILAFTPDWANLAQGMARDGVVVPALVRQLRGAVGDPYGGSVHRGATSQDVIDSALMLQLGRIWPILDARLEVLDRGFERLIEEFGEQRAMAHTRMQAALPIAAADKIAAWRTPLARLRPQLAQGAKAMLVVQVGGPVGDRSSFDGHGDAVAAGVAARLGLADGDCWHTQRDRLVGFATQLSLISGVLGKLGADVVLLAQSEVAEIRLATGGGSSAMPHKTNPVAAEVLQALARHSAGLIGTLNNALLHEGERSGAAWTLEWLVLPQIVMAAGAGMRLAHELVSGISFADAGRGT